MRLRSTLAAVLLLLALLPGGAVLLPARSGAQENPTGSGPAIDAAGASGAQLYAKYCAQCHGDKGDGRGVAADRLRPAPRDFTSGKYQVRSTPTGALPTDDDLRRVIRDGIPYTAMPAFPDFSATQLEALVRQLKAFSPKFQGAAPQPLELAADPGFQEGRIEEARQVYEQIGCAGCHGREGRGDGPSAPTLRDDWGQAIRAADLTRPWTFNGGASREDIFRSLSTGLNGTPMAGFQSALTDEQRWLLVDFIQSLAGADATAPGYDTLVVARQLDGELDLARGAELFAEAAPALFPLAGQIVQPGRSFQPFVVAVEARAVYNDEEVAVLVRWHDVRADRGGNNGPDFELPAEEELPGLSLAAPTGGAAADPFAEEETAADPFADEEQAAPAADPFADLEAGGTGGGEAGGPGEREGAAAAAESEFSDAVAVQFPRALPTGVRLPYFLFGDEQEPVELWFVDLANPGRVELWEGRGSANLAPGEGMAPAVQASFADGRWTVIYKRKRNAGSGIRFPDDTFVPVAFSVWDGMDRDRGNKRALTSWYHLYIPPADQPSPVGPMVRAAGVVLLLELLVIGWARRRRSRRAAAAAVATSEAAS